MIEFLPSFHSHSRSSFFLSFSWERALKELGESFFHVIFLLILLFYCCFLFASFIPSFVPCVCCFCHHPYTYLCVSASFLSTISLRSNTSIIQIKRRKYENSNRFVDAKEFDDFSFFLFHFHSDYFFLFRNQAKKNGLKEWDEIV